MATKRNKKSDNQLNMEAGLDLQVPTAPQSDMELLMSLLGDDTAQVEATEEGDGFLAAMADLEEIDLSDDSAVSDDDADLLALELDLEAATPAPAPVEAAPVVEPEPEAVVEEAEMSDDDLHLALADIEKAEAIQALYQEQKVEDQAVSPSDIPATPPDAAPEQEEDKGKKKLPKKPTTSRVTYVSGKPSDVLMSRLGDKTSETLILELADAELDPEVLAERQKELLALLNKRPNTGEGGSTQKKVAEKIVMLFGWIKSGGKLNEVMHRTFKVLARDGQITSGDKGNLHAELLSKPYSLGTARAQSGQMLQMLPMLKIAKQDGKGRLVANPNSLIFMKACAELGYDAKFETTAA